MGADQAMATDATQASTGRFSANARRDGEARKWCTRFRQGHQFVQRMARPIQQLVRVRRIPVDPDLLALGLVNSRRRKLHRQLKPV